MKKNVKYEVDYQQAGAILLSLQERNQRLEQCHEKEVLNVEAAQKEAIRLKEELSIQKNSNCPEVVRQLQKLTESEKIAREGQNSLREILSTERELREKSAEQLAGALLSLREKRCRVSQSFSHYPTE